MRVRYGISLISLMGLMGLAALPAAEGKQQRLERLLNRAVIIDLHSDTTQLMLLEDYDMGRRHSYAQEDIPRMR